MQLTNIMNIENDKIGSVIHKRLSELCKELKISERKFSISIGKSPSYISSLNKDITSEVLHNISVKYNKTRKLNYFLFAFIPVVSF